MRIGRLHVITDVTLQQRFDHLELAVAAIQGGADVIQLRDKRASTRSLIETAVAIASLCRRQRRVLIVNDRLDVAAAADAGGLHLGDEDMPIGLARRILGPDRILGASGDRGQEAVLRARAGADYVGVGPVFATPSKRDAGPVLGLTGLAEAVRSSPIPVIAIGGISLDNLASVLATGVHGIAILAAVCLAEDPAAIVREFRERIGDDAHQPGSSP